jgi:hypothetical protein
MLSRLGRRPRAARLAKWIPTSPLRLSRMEVAAGRANASRVFDVLEGASLRVARSDWTTARVLFKMNKRHCSKSTRWRHGCLAWTAVRAASHACLVVIRGNWRLRQPREAAPRGVLEMCVHDFTLHNLSSTIVTGFTQRLTEFFLWLFFFISNQNHSDSIS